MNVTDWPLYRYTATVERVIDGDTVQVNLSLGDRTYRTRRIRILGYDAPELFSGSNREAGAAAKSALEHLLPPGERVYLATQLDHTSFDRLLATLYVATEGGDLVDVADLMVAGGFGVSTRKVVQV